MISRAMRRLRARAGERAGFSIIEVLAAMIILAVGLLALQAMAIGAVQRNAASNRQMTYTLLATEYLERDLALARMGPGNPASRQETAPGGIPVQIVVTPMAAGLRPAFQIAVTVTPPADERFPLRPITVVGSAIR